MKPIKKLTCQMSMQAQERRLSFVAMDSLTTIKDALKIYFNGEFEFKNPDGERDNVACVFYDYFLEQSRDGVIKCIKIDDKGALMANIVELIPCNTDESRLENWKENGDWYSLELHDSQVLLLNAYDSILHALASDEYWPEE